MAPGDGYAGATLRFERSPYAGHAKDYDYLPLARYDSEYFYLSTYRAGLKLGPAELFVKRRFEGYPSDDIPESMAGLDVRRPGADAGIALKHRWGAGTAYAELMTDASNKSEGSELRLGYRYEAWWNGRLRFRPYATLAWRDSKLNDYYYGVPGYSAGSGVNLEIGAIATYRLTESWQVLAGVELIRYASAISNSPAVDQSLSPSFTFGLLYNFTPQPAPPGERKPLIMRAFYGQSTDCDLFPIVTLQCTSTHTQDQTDVAAVEIGQTLVKRVGGYNMDIQGFVGLLQHREDGLQDDFWQAQAYLKISYYGFPWRETLRTRVGIGAGIAYASHIPFGEQRDQALRNRDTSKLLLYLDPTVDFSVGDLVGSRPLRDTYLGLGVSHRSGTFGWSQLFNNVDGGSNYIYAFVETSF